jgi:HAMP domain-containing protein
MPGVFRMKLRTRMFVIFFLASILPLILMAVLSYHKARLMLVMDPSKVIESLLYLTAFLLTVTLAVALILSRQFGTGIVDPVQRMEAAMARVEQGDLTANVTVNRNDELGALAENFNQMTEGLKDPYRLRQSLDLAKEVQQNLLPEKNRISPAGTLPAQASTVMRPAAIISTFSLPLSLKQKHITLSSLMYPSTVFPLRFCWPRPEGFCGSVRPYRAALPMWSAMPTIS